MSMEDEDDFLGGFGDEGDEEGADECGEDEDYLIDGVGFADPGGNSALRAETENNPRNQPCPECGTANVLTPIDVRQGYRCDRCANLAEHGGY